MVDLFDKHILEVINENTSPELSEAHKDTKLPTHIAFEKINENLKHDVSYEALKNRLNKLQEGTFLTSENGKWCLTYKGKMILEDFWDTVSQLKTDEEEKIRPEEVEEDKSELKQEVPKSLISSKLIENLENLDLKQDEASQFLKELERSHEAGLISDELYNSSKAQFLHKLDEIKTQIKEKKSLSSTDQLEETETMKKGISELQEKKSVSSTKKVIERLGLFRNKAFLLISTGSTFLLTGFLLIAEIHLATEIPILGVNAWLLSLSIGVILTLMTGIIMSQKRSE